MARFVSEAENLKISSCSLIFYFLALYHSFLRIAVIFVLSSFACTGSIRLKHRLGSPNCGSEISPRYSHILYIQVLYPRLVLSLYTFESYHSFEFWRKVTFSKKTCVFFSNLQFFKILRLRPFIFF